MSFDNETGVFILNHDENENICAIMVWFDNLEAAEAIAVFIGEKINPEFSSDNAIAQIVYGESYTSGNMTVMPFELEEDFDIVLLAPSEYIAEILS